MFAAEETAIEIGTATGGMELGGTVAAEATAPADVPREVHLRVGPHLASQAEFAERFDRGAESTTILCIARDLLRSSGPSEKTGSMTPDHHSREQD